MTVPNLTPVELEMLFHYYYTSTLLPVTEYFTAARLKLMRLSLLEDSPEGLRTTNLGSAFVKMIMSLPLPTEKLVYVDRDGNVI